MTSAISLDASGLDLFERKLATAVGKRGNRGSLEVLTLMARGVPTYSPGPTYAALCALTHAYLVPLPLIEADGNMGLWGDPPAPPEYTKCRLSPSGKHAASSDNNIESPIPFDLVNGTLHKEGSRPPLDPKNLALSIIRIADGDRDEVHGGTDGVEASWFPFNAEAAGDWAELSAGGAVNYRFKGRVEVADNKMTITGLPLEANPRAVEMAVQSQIRRYALDMSGPTGPHIQVELKDTDDAISVRRAILDLPVMTSHRVLSFDAPISDLIRAWINMHGTDAAIQGAHRLLALVA